MIHLPVKQGSQEWLKARLGIPTASGFSKLLTKTGKASTQAGKYMHELLAEFFIGEPMDSVASGFMSRGTQLEASARKRYEYEREVDVVLCGLCLRDDRMAGASPDALVGDDGLLEIKVPAAATHIDYLLGGLEGEYWAQCQGQLYVTGRAWVDLVAYNPALPQVVVRIQRDDDWIAALVDVLDPFVERMLAARERLQHLGCSPAEHLLLTADSRAIERTPF